MLSTTPGRWAALLCMSLALGGAPASAETVTYQLTVRLDWDGTDPTGMIDPIPSPHLSHKGVATHSGTVGFWQLGSPASPGIATMAVTGWIGSTPFPPPFDTAWASEAAAAGAAAGPFYAYTFDTAPQSSSVLEFQIVDTHSLVTVASMIGPSPDWFVGISSLELRPGGEWVQHLEIPMTTYDGGIKSTDAFIFDPNGPASAPGTPIQLLSSVSSNPFATAPMGAFIFDLQTQLPTMGALPRLVLIGSMIAVPWFLFGQFGTRWRNTHSPRRGSPGNVE